MNRFFEKNTISLKEEILFIERFMRLALKDKIYISLNKDYIARPGKPKERYFEIGILEFPSRFVKFFINKEFFVIRRIYVYETPARLKNIYTHLNHTLSIDPKDEFTEETAVKTFKNWLEETFGLDKEVIIVDIK